MQEQFQGSRTPRSATQRWHTPRTHISLNTCTLTRPITASNTTLKKNLIPLETAGVCGVYFSFLIMYCSSRKSNWFWSHCNFKGLGELWATEAFNKRCARKRLKGFQCHLTEPKPGPKRCWGNFSVAQSGLGRSRWRLSLFRPSTRMGERQRKRSPCFAYSLICSLLLIKPFQTD